MNLATEFARVVYPLAAVLVATCLGYTLALYVWSRTELRGARRLPSRHRAFTPAESKAEDLFYVFFIPCLNEARVIGNTLSRMHNLPGDFAVLVIDDGSDDGTGDIVDAYADPRMRVLRRVAPEARQGKGEALNAAARWLLESDLLAGRDPHQVIVAVVDADGRLEENTLPEVGKCFTDTSVGAVQIGVRINNRFSNWLARMQDLEFIIYTSVFQRGRRHLGSVGMGGNGQFVRLSALRTLGEKPWTKALTEDFDLGVRLLMKGWCNEYCSTASVHQQGLVDSKRLLRQRTRWFQGALQAWKLIPLILREGVGATRIDLLYQITGTALIMVASILTASFVIGTLAGFIALAIGFLPLSAVLANLGTAYLLAVGPVLLLASRYFAAERAEGASRAKVLVWAHQYVCYALLWYVTGWWALIRMVRGASGWAKTERVAEKQTGHAPAVAGNQRPHLRLVHSENEPTRVSRSA